jgi:hypothetical protein
MTNVFHEPIEENSDQTPSMLRMCCPERTIPPSRCVVIHGRCYDFSKDREVTANFEHLPAICRLPDNLSSATPVSHCRTKHQLTFRLVHLARDLIHDF